MSEEMNKGEFAELLEKSEKDMPTPNVGDVVEATIVAVTDSEVLVNIPGVKSDVPVQRQELADEVEVGDVIKVCITSTNNEDGPKVSKKKADQMEIWHELKGVMERGETVEAKVTQVVKGGLVASVRGLRGFIPASQMELHFVKDLSVYQNQTVTALPIEVDVIKQRLVLSRRQILAEERAKRQEEIFSTLEVGQTVRGTVKRLVDYGAFIDIGGVDGLAHISDLSWDRVKHPGDVLAVGQELDVYIKNVDTENRRISLSVKDTMRDPWFDRAERYAEGDHIEGKVIKLTDFGAFMEIEPNFDGLIPMGELSEKRIERADEAVHTGDIVTVKIIRIDLKKKRISLSIARADKSIDPSLVKRYGEAKNDAPQQQEADAIEEAAPAENAENTESAENQE